ncbi:hypothetical protein GCM10017786_27030 [Amycolatopsis deserti]|uniref:Uncharacterized protein n=1 Tax=Amycolatopsis deserti TaxID=185696 RepID=A0ABQ3IY67_9PSEU|nr:hypothetical protein GCM10017786_27030 [Amycolatopsis deserti]
MRGAWSWRRSGWEVAAARALAGRGADGCVGTERWGWCAREFEAVRAWAGGWLDGGVGAERCGWRRSGWEVAAALAVAGRGAGRWRGHGAVGLARRSGWEVAAALAVAGRGGADGCVGTERWGWRAGAPGSFGAAWALVGRRRGAVKAVRGRVREFEAVRARRRGRVGTLAGPGVAAAGAFE